MDTVIKNGIRILESGECYTHCKLCDREEKCKYIPINPNIFLATNLYPKGWREIIVSRGEIYSICPECHIKTIGRIHIEGCRRCEWFDKKCPDCGEMSYAYHGVLVNSSYALLCNNRNCRNFVRVALLDDFDEEIKESNYININDI
jgi:hypothetical protein